MNLRVGQEFPGRKMQEIHVQGIPISKKKKHSAKNTGPSQTVDDHLALLVDFFWISSQGSRTHLMNGYHSEGVFLLS